jgi:uncharacterized protein YgiM (DUF1202 family)
VVIINGLALREGPGITYQILGVLNEGDTLMITGRSPNKGWIQVKTASGEEGWCSSNTAYVQLNVSLDDISVSQEIPATPVQVVQGPTGVPTQTSTPEPDATPTPTESSPTSNMAPPASSQTVHIQVWQHGYAPLFNRSSHTSMSKA